VEDGFKLRSQMSDGELEEAEHRQKERLKTDLNKYSNMKELKDMYKVV
jgi:hypothetical protein